MPTTGKQEVPRPASQIGSTSEAKSPRYEALLTAAQAGLPDRRCPHF